jgi:hypothetical protein
MVVVFATEKRGAITLTSLFAAGTPLVISAVQHYRNRTWKAISETFREMSIFFARLFHIWRKACAESVVCLVLGFWDAAKSPRLLIRSSLLCILSALAWAFFYYHFSEALGYFFLFLSFIGTFGLLLGGFQGLIPMAAHTGSSVVAAPAMGINFIISAAQALILVAAVVAVLYVLFYLFLVVTTVRIAVPHILLPIATERVSHGLALANIPTTSQEDGVRRKPWNRVLFLAALMCIPVVAIVLILAGICYLNVRLIYANIARGSSNRTLLISNLRHRWRPLLLIGIALLLLVAVPILNLLAPALMCTSVLHLAYRDNIARLADPASGSK